MFQSGRRVTAKSELCVELDRTELGCGRELRRAERKGIGSQVTKGLVSDFKDFTCRFYER